MFISLSRIFLEANCLKCQVLDADFGPPRLRLGRSIFGLPRTVPLQQVPVTRTVKTQPMPAFAIVEI